MPTIFKDPVEIGGITFNGDPPEEGVQAFVDVLDGWDDPPDPRLETAAFGFTDGISVGDRASYAERYITMAGAVFAPDRATAERWRHKLRGIFHRSPRINLVRFGPIPMRIEIQASSGFNIPPNTDTARAFRFIVLLLMPWPYKEAINELGGEAGVYTGGSYYRLYPRVYPEAMAGGTYGRVYLPDNTVGNVVGVETRRNHVHNPRASLTAALTGTSTGGVVTRTTGAGMDDYDTSFVMTATGGVACNFSHQADAAPGEAWAGAVRARATTLTNRFGRIGILYRQGSTTLVTSLSPVYALPGVDGPGQRIAHVAAAAPPNTDNVQIVFYCYSGGAGAVPTAGAVYRVSAFQLEKDLPGMFEEYFDGDTPPSSEGAISHGWAGTDHDSDSIQTMYVVPDDVEQIADAVDIYNEGNADAYPVLEVQGPLEANTWYIVNETTGQRMRLDYDLSSTSVVVLHTRDKSAYLGETSVEYRVSGDWISLPPGQVSRIRLVAAEGSAARLRVRGYSTYI